MSAKPTYVRCETCGGAGHEFRNSPSYGWRNERCDDCHGTGYRAAPATAVPSPEVIAAIRRVKEITTWASAVLILEGDFGRQTTETAHLTRLLDASTLPQDWERLDDYLKGLPL